MASKQNKAIKRKLPQDLTLTDEELDKKLREGQNENTVKSEKKAHKAFTRYLSQNGAEDLNYWFFEEPELDNWLAKFWLCVRKEEDDTDSETESQQDDHDRKTQMYSANSLRLFRYGLNRILRREGHLYKITDKGTSFLKSDEAFKLAVKELKAEGKAEIHSHPEINEQGTVQITKIFIVFCSGSNDIFFWLGLRK